ncbi:non-reducing end alpha-L-arabinofuranosidase family hydrolase [Sorangium sp. So ce295]|uniref:non-reducing end alpha-L-arabinofuranosidase family hydrolase n=1 Tax=Sorangium sp. So ce295 TaxID=3133295 RepID=UPI003F60CD31
MMRIRFRRWALLATLAATAACVSAEQLDEDGPELDELAESVTIDTAATYTITGVQSGKCVEVAGGSTADAAAMQIASCNGSTRQQFRMESAGGGYYRIRNVNSNRCMDVAGASTSDGARIQQYSCWSGENQQWSFTDVASGVVRLTARNSGKSLDVYARGTADGTAVIQWASNGGTNQQFRITPVSSGTGTGGTGGTGGSGGTGGTGGTGGAGGSGGGEGCGLPTTFRWQSSSALVSPKSDATHNIVSIKDPTVSFFNDRWHIYATTANTAGNWQMTYLNFTDWSQAASASHYYMDRTPGFSGYRCAPQMFFFRPQNKWYLIYQSQPPQFSTTSDPSRPDTWTRPQNFFASTPAGMPSLPIDYWVICDSANCYLFFTGDDGRMYRSQTTVQNFPNGFGPVSIALQDSNRNNLFEGSSTYKIKGMNKYLTLIEAIGPTGARFYRSFTADRLDGAWTPLAHTWNAPFAGQNNVTYASGVADWSDDVSHGELVRDGNDETATIDTCNLQFLYQGRNPSSGGEYSQLPYRLGLLKAVR